MRAIIKSKGAPGAEIAEVPVPSVGPKEILIKVIAASICGTDIHIYTWDKWAQTRIRPPIIFGHEVVGEVVEVGKDVEHINPGAYVSAETHISCGFCYLCRTGNRHLCQNLKILGIDVDGAFAEYVVIPEENAWVTDRTIPPEIASIQEPFGNAVHATLVEQVTGKTVVVFGCGPIGCMSIAVASASGASKIFAVEPNPFRLKMGERMGATRLINPKQEDPEEIILDETNGVGVDVFLEMSGAQQAINEGMKALRKAGRVSFLGIPSGDIVLDFAEDIVFKGAVLYGINGRKMFETWYQAQELLTSGKVDLSPLITHKMRFEEIDRAVELLINKEAGKITLFPE